MLTIFILKHDYIPPLALYMLSYYNYFFFKCPLKVISNFLAKKKVLELREGPDSFTIT